jgi:16S rRNA G1207 methylase RsmC
MQNIFEQSFGNVNVLAKKSGYRVLLSKKTWLNIFE